MTLKHRIQKLESGTFDASRPIVILRKIIALGASGPVSMGVRVARTQNGSFYRDSDESEVDFLIRAGVEPSEQGPEGL